MEQPMRSPRFKPFKITWNNSFFSFSPPFRVFFKSKSSPRPPVKSSIASMVWPPFRASYEPCSLEKHTTHVVNSRAQIWHNCLMSHFRPFSCVFAQACELKINNIILKCCPELSIHVFHWFAVYLRWQPTNHNTTFFRQKNLSLLVMESIAFNNTELRSSELNEVHLHSS